MSEVTVEMNEMIPKKDEIRPPEKPYFIRSSYIRYSNNIRNIQKTNQKEMI